jgi:hypothetical protein
MARDRYLPRIRVHGDRLAIRTGSWCWRRRQTAHRLFGRHAQLISLYAVGVFVGFTLSQTAWSRTGRARRGWRRAMAINAVGNSASAVVVIIAATKFTHGAWLTILAIMLLALLFHQIGQHYRRVQRELAVSDDDGLIAVTSGRHGLPVIMPIDELNRATARAVAYALSISNNVVALHVTDDLEDADALRLAWERRVLDVPLVIVESEYRSLLGPVLAYVDSMDRAGTQQTVTVVLPEYLSRWPWQRLLPSHVTTQAGASQRSNIVVIEVPYHLG